MAAGPAPVRNARAGRLDIFTLLRRVIRRRTKIQNRTDRLDTEPISVLINELD
jgi:hypothetical protein